MYAKNIPLEEFRLVAELVGINVDYERKSNNIIRFTLKINKEFPDLYRKLSPQPQDISWADEYPKPSSWKWRKANGVCFHGHWAFINLLLQRNSEHAVIDSLSRIRYTVATFEEKAREFGDSRMGQPGNIYHEFKIRDLCNCEGVKK